MTARRFTRGAHGAMGEVTSAQRCPPHYWMGLDAKRVMCGDCGAKRLRRKKGKGKGRIYRPRGC